MAILIGTVVTWMAVTFFSIIPKKIPPFETIFLFCVNTIFELSIFSILHLNLKFIVVEPGIGNGIADLMLRLIELPLLLVASSNILLYSNKVKWCWVALIILFTLLVQQTLEWMDIITFQRWNIMYTGIYMCVNVAFSSMMTWVITSLDKKETA
ncbi:hypothetical protein SD70_18640 [Gordoniibacillus kamchatkensis]|uniref:Uncharacterized protein n=1 Tax=Gordoniibacillus kamchatkensis TaxID=1590651 RepID=A0ABR5AF23_9BACL|nr:hypothetical protein [Paenibacillus sp. VKM B-2647]KIL39660.1 hypothetical protein SD70_18640 [Paenibacillus sp. VKM B-2647]